MFIYSLAALSCQLNNFKESIDYCSKALIINKANFGEKNFK